MESKATPQSLKRHLLLMLNVGHVKTPPRQVRDIITVKGLHKEYLNLNKQAKDYVKA